MNPNLQALVGYVAVMNPKGVNQVAYKYGYLPPVSEEGRQGFLYRGIMEEGDDFFKDIARIHPDRELILNADGSEPINNGSTVIESSQEKTIIKSDNKQLIRIIIFIVIAYIVYKIFEK